MGLPKLFYIVILPLTLWIFRRYVYLVYAVPFAAVNAVASAVAGPGRDADRDSLKSLMSNVTSDYHQLANLMQEFVHSPDVPSETEARLRSFLSSKASMSFPMLELYLDIVIKIYWIVMPVLVVVVVARLFGGNDGKDSDTATESKLGATHNGFSRRSSAAPSGLPRRSSSGDAQGGRASGSHQGLSGEAGYRTAGHRGAEGHRRPNGNAHGR